MLKAEWQTCKFNDDQQGLPTGLSANSEEVDDVHVAPDLLHYLHFLTTEMIINDGVPNDDESP